MANNVFWYLTNGGNNTRSIQNLNDLPVKNGGHLVFPPGLAGEPLSDRTQSSFASIPFTLFMPYKRTGFYSVGNLFHELPTPEFAIALPTPTSALKTDYAVKYDEFAIGQALGAVGQNLGASVAGVKELNTAGATDALKELFAAGGNVAKIAFTDSVKALLDGVGSSGEVVSVLIGAQDNPFTENVFKNVDFRVHEFAYTFMPKNLNESKTIDSIINVFKFAMLPRPGTAGFLDFPYEFQITHSIQSTTFTLLPSVLETFNVDYGGGADTPKLFNPTDGSQLQYPAKISINMRFKEMVLLTRDKILQDVQLADGAPAANTLRYRF
jgi:hypothetical protein